MRGRFPALSDGWARLDGPAGTQMVDTAIAAMQEQLSDGGSANTGGFFAASAATADLVRSARVTVARLLGADPCGIVFGANMTTLAFAFARAVARDLEPGDEILCTALDHDANIAPWFRAAQAAGATVVIAPFDPATGRLPTDAVTSRIGERTRWVAITGASNALGTTPDLPPVVLAAHAVGARVFVDGVHLVPHRRIDVSALGFDVLATSAYKWYGPHAGMLCADPALLARLDPDKVRPAPDEGPARYETGTPAFEALAGIRASAEFLTEVDVDAELGVFAPMLHGLLAMPHVTVWGPQDLVDRTPTLAFTVAGHHPDEVAQRLADARVAVWSGDYYAVDVMASLGLAESGGAVRAGVDCYTDPEDVARLLEVVDELG
jgi:cysteine desulfurase family protein (TIGR01976 family)